MDYFWKDMQNGLPSFVTSKFYFGDFETEITEIAGDRHTIVITDENVRKHYQDQHSSENTIVLPAGEGSKSMDTIAILTEKLIEHRVHKKSLIVGLGGGVITDITGYIATIYMRGIPFAFVPTTLLGMVDAAIGGKNGINFGKHKNMLGTFSQPEFIYNDTKFLSTLPDEEWSNGFAEIIKYACLFDENLLKQLAERDLKYYQSNPDALLKVIRQCAAWKDATVAKDEKDNGMRKTLNFGHTCGHAIETIYNLPHGQAVALGMMIACIASEQFTQLDAVSTEVIKKAIGNFQLPADYIIEPNKVMDLIEMDKKRDGEKIDFITLSKIGQPSITPLSFADIRKALELFNNANSH